jgi:gluconate 2-dehydrogenase gamma chain
MSEFVKDEVVEASQAPNDRRVSRRLFLKGSGVAAAAAGTAAVGAVALVEGPSASTAQEATPAASPAAGGLETAGDERPAAFFDIHEAETVDAIASRLLPGSADDPGAHEAGVVFYIDAKLAGANLGYALKTYTQGPFPVTNEEPVTAEAGGSRDIYVYSTIAVPADLLSRYGYQSILTPQEVYRRGLGFVDAYAQSTFQQDFVDLAPEQQDQILSAMESGEATGFEGPSATAFFTTLRNDTIEGMFSDPMYGGNQNLVGWRLIGYPGAQRFYTPDDLKNPNFQREPQSLAELMAKEGH